MANTLKFGAGNWATKEGSTLAYNDENENFKPLPFDFTRASNATRVNKEGLIETVGNGIPRIDFADSEDGALLLEPQRTNFDSDSENFATSFMSNNNGIQSSALVSEIAPDGTTNSVYKTSKVTDNSDPYIGRSGVSFTNTSMTFSVWLWTDEDQPKDVLLLIYRDSIAEITTKNITLTTTPTRYFIEKTFSNTPSNISYRIDLTPNSSNQYIYAWGKQLEQGYLTSYIKTEGSAVTRVKDICSNGGNEQVINSTEGVLYVLLSDIKSQDFDSIIINNGIADENNQVRIWFYNNTITYQYKVGSNVSAQITTSTMDLTLDTKIACSWKLNEFKLFVNGSKINQDLSGSVLANNTLESVEFKRGNNTGNFYGNVRDLKVYNTALTDQELAALTQV